jgi:large subunit ribosomal protein L16
VGISKKPREIRMGKGKGGVSFWACGIKRGQILYEVSGVNNQKSIDGSFILSC